MTTRYIKKTVILAALEAVIGTDAVPTGAANALKVFDVSISPVELKQIQLDYITAWFGSSETIPGTVFSKCSFSVSLSGAGLAATPPAWGTLMLGCGNSETSGLLVPNRVEYLPATDLLKTLTIYWYDDGVLHKLLGASGNVKLSAKSGEAPKLMFELTGLKVPATATPNVAGVLANWKPPVSITKANVTDIVLGCTYAAGTLVGGTPFNSTGLTLDWGNKVDFSDFLSSEEVGISDRKITGSLSLKLTAAEEVAKIAEIEAATMQGMGFVIGKTSGNQILLHAPAMRLKTHKKEEVNGKRTVGFDFELNPVAGNDELRIVHL